MSRLGGRMELEATQPSFSSWAYRFSVFKSLLIHFRCCDLSWASWYWLNTWLSNASAGTDSDCWSNLSSVLLGGRCTDHQICSKQRTHFRSSHPNTTECWKLSLWERLHLALNLQGNPRSPRSHLWVFLRVSFRELLQFCNALQLTKPDWQKKWELQS